LQIALNEPEIFKKLPKPLKKLAREFLKKILEQENPERLQRLLRRLEANILKTPPIVNEAYDPKKLLLTVVAERGQQLMLDRMEPSDAMVTALMERYGYVFSPEILSSWRKKTILDWAYQIIPLMVKNRNPRDDNERDEFRKEIIKEFNQKFNLSLPPEWSDADIAKNRKEINRLREQIRTAWQNQYPEAPFPKNIREWIKVMGINEEMSELKKQLLEAEKMSINEEQQKQYQAAYQSVEQEIQKILETTTADEQQKNLKWDQFPPHPVLARWGEIEETIDKLPEGRVKDKIKAVFEAKRKLAEKQEYYTNLFLETTIKYMPGGYYGWNEELKGVLEALLEASPYFASLFKEPNCVGRIILLSGMLMEAQVFEEKHLVTMATYKHAFLRGFDGLSVGRVIEGSGPPKHSYFGIPKEKFFQGKVFNNQEIIFQLPLKIGLLNEAGINYLSLLEEQKARKLKLYLLQQSGYIKDNLWYNLSISLDNLDSFFSRSRAASINNLFPRPFYYLLYHNQEFYKAFVSLILKKSSPLLPYIKLNLLVMQKAFRR
jgi:hypothetical protein